MTLEDLLTETVEVNCTQCQGMGSSIEGSHGYCSACKGSGYIRKSKYAMLTDAERVDVLEKELLKARPELERFRRKA